jgi:hypothetical protein
MLRSLENLLGYEIAGTNGVVGTAADFFFVDDRWTLRYLVVSTGGWLNRSQVLLSPDTIGRIDDAKRQIEVNLTWEMVCASPDAASDRPVSRQMEILLASHYGWKQYWSPDPVSNGSVGTEPFEAHAELAGNDPHLRSYREISVYEMNGNTGLGHVTDVIVNDVSWRVDGLVASKTGRQDGEAMIISPRGVSGIDWRSRRIQLVPEIVEFGLIAPFSSRAPVNPRKVAEYFDYCGRFHHIAVLPETSESKEGD